MIVGIDPIDKSVVINPNTSTGPIRCEMAVSPRSSLSPVHPEAPDRPTVDSARHSVRYARERRGSVGRAGATAGVRDRRRWASPIRFVKRRCRSMRS